MSKDNKEYESMYNKEYERSELRIDAIEKTKERLSVTRPTLSSMFA